MSKPHSTTTGIHRVEPACIPHSAHLTSWSEDAWRDGLQIDRLRDLDVVRVRTLNTLYEITIVSAPRGEAIVRGGVFFPEASRALILGSSLGGAFLKVRGIYCGFSLEIFAAGTRIVTSAVQWVQLSDSHAMGRVQ